MSKALLKEETGMISFIQHLSNHWRGHKDQEGFVVDGVLLLVIPLEDPDFLVFRYQGSQCKS